MDTLEGLYVAYDLIPGRLIPEREVVMRSITVHLSKGLVLATVALILALGSPGWAQTMVINYKFGLVGVVFDAGQAVQVNVSHIQDPDQAPAPCDARVEFLDGATGAVLKTARLTVPSGQTQSADLGVTEPVPLKGKVPIYARVTIGDPNIHPACGRPSLEVFDKSTGRTAAGVWNPGERGAPEAFFPALTLVTGQALRVNAVNYGDPNEAPCPVLLAIFKADGTDLQQQSMLASGVGTFLDAAVGNPDARIQFRAAGSRAISDRTRCRAFVFSVEVYDLATGITTLLIGDPGI